jgi:hypothetical protein
MRDSFTIESGGMKRLARHLFTFVSAVSLLLFVAVCVLWGPSLFVGDWFNGSDGAGVRWSVFSVRGQLLYYKGWEAATTGSAQFSEPRTRRGEGDSRAAN